MGLLDALGKGLEFIGEGAFGGQMREKYGPDWRERVAYERWQRGQAQRNAEIQEEASRQSLADKLAESVAAMMEAQGDGQERGPEAPYYLARPDAEPQPPEPDYSASIPESALRASGRRAEDVVRAGRGRLAGSRRQLQILRGMQQGEILGRRQTFQTGEREAGQTFRAGESEKGREFRRGERIATEGGRDRRARTARDEGSIRQTLRDIDSESRRALRDFQAGKITRAQYEQRIAEATEALADPFPENVETRVPTAQEMHVAEFGYELPDEEHRPGRKVERHGPAVEKRRKADGTYEYRDAAGKVWSE